MEYGIVFAGGGAKGAYQIGALKALEELGLTNKILGISGTSIGGINLSLTAASTVEKAYNAWQSFKADDFLEEDDNGFDILKYGDGILSRTALINIVKENVDFGLIRNSNIPLYVTVCYRDETLVDRVKYVKLNGLQDEYIEKYFLATSAIPLVYDMVEIDGIKYFDGGLLDNTPIMPLYAEGIENIIVISNDNEYKTSKGDFPGANIIDIVPSASLDSESLIGTLDFDPSHAIYRLRLGYYDAKAIMTAYLEGKPLADISNNIVLAKNEMRVQNADLNAKKTFDKIDNLLSKYGIE